MNPLPFKIKLSKIVIPPTLCKICNKDFLNARALVQHTQLIHQHKYDWKG